MSNLVQLGPQYFPMSSIGTPIGAGSLYIGDPDTDPTVVGNQKTVSALKEDNTLVALSQPITLSAGGIPLYNSSPVSLYVSGNYSMAVLDINDAQVYYTPSFFRIQESPLTPGNYYYPDYSEADQGVAGSGETVNTFIDAIGVTNKATIYFRHNSGNEFTDYIYLTSELGTDNIFFEFEPGARLKLAVGITQTVFHPENIIASPLQQIINIVNNSTNPLIFTEKGIMYPEWVGAVADGVTNDGPSIQICIDAMIVPADKGGGEIHFIQDDYFSSIELVQLGYVSWLGIGDRTVVTYDNSRSGWLLTIDFATRYFANTFSIKNMQFEIEGSTGSPVGVIRVVDSIGFKMYESSIKASATAEGIRFENDELYCESVTLKNVGVDIVKYGVRFVSSDEAAVNPPRYTPVTGTGSISFNQTFFENVHVRVSENGHGFRIGGDFDRSLFNNCGGWTLTGTVTGAMFEILNELGNMTFINPWLDDTSDTFRLFDFTARVERSVIINPHGPDHRQMVIDYLGYFSLGTKFLGTLIQAKSDHPNTKGGHFIENSRYAEFIHHSFNSALDADNFVTTGTVSVTTFPSVVQITPDTGPAGANFLISKFYFPNVGPGIAVVEFRFMASDFTDLGIYFGTSNNGTGQYISTLASNGALQGFLITNENAAGALGANLYAVAMAAAEEDRVDLGAVIVDKWYDVKLIFYRDGAVNYADCFINDTYKDQLIITAIPNGSAFKVNAYNAGATGEILSVDDIIYSNNRPGRT